MPNLRILFASLFLCAGSVLLAQEPAPLTCTDDIKTVTTQVGKEVVFCGTPSAVKAVTKDDGSSRLYMDFGGVYPENTFSVTISGKVSGAEHAELKERFEGKEIMVKGTVELYRDKPQINVQRMEDIRLK